MKITYLNCHGSSRWTENWPAGFFYSKSKVVDGEGSVDTITFGPVFIDPKYHRQGLGRHLITHSIEHAKSLGYRAILTLGYPYHYEPYGFVGGKRYDIAMPDGQYYKGLLVLPLYEGALEGVRGMAVFTEGLEMEEAEVEVFDATFPKKQKEVLPSQREYEFASTELDES
ncbi:GNAT family N-acetyltransferase [Exiguobacterium sp. s59]|uniref:GNAT family N-acetyltransferase n=1 Tax=Exiguobacterium sp. s59 TaxID=2751269 RepID=UPI001BE813F4|nr:N-acetyltransferase [Exiguobacterium sp. s59]